MQYQLYYPCPEEVKILLYEDGAALNIHESWFQALFERACRGIFRFSEIIGAYSGKNLEIWIYCHIFAIPFEKHARLV